MKYMFYHCTCYGDNWSEGINESFARLSDSGLYNELQNIFVNFSLPPDIEDIVIPPCCDMPKTKVKVTRKASYGDTKYEFCSNSQSDTLELLWNFCKKLDANTHILYAHNEGVCEKVEGRWLPHHFREKDFDENIASLKEYLEYEAMYKWKDYTEALNTHSTAGPYLMLEPTVYYFGNFWWANSIYLNTLNKPDKAKDLFPDYWVLSSLHEDNDVSKDNMDYFRYTSKRDFFTLDIPEVRHWNCEPWKHKIPEQDYKTG